MLKSILKAARRITFSAVMAIALVSVMVFEAPVQAAAATEPKYIESIIMVSADNTEAAKAKLPEGYVLVNDPIYEGQDVDKDTTVRTYLAYKPTINRKDAIVDIQAMHMTGGYGYEEYRAFLENQKTISAQLVDGLKDAIKEFRANYKAGKAGAKYANGMLSYYVDDDYVNDPKYGKARTIADIFRDETIEDSVLVKIVMESNIDILGNIERLLAIACSDTASQTIFDYLNDPYFTFSEDAVDAGVYNTYAADIINSLEDLQNPIRYFESFFWNDIYDVLAEYDRQGALIEHYMSVDRLPYIDMRARVDNETRGNNIGKNAMDLRKALDDGHLSDEQKLHFNIGRTLYGALNNTAYEGVVSDDIYSLYDLVMQHRIVNGNGKDEYKLEDFYPLISVLTLGQRGMMKVGLSELLMAQLIGRDMLMDYMAAMSDAEKGVLKPSETLSIYMGVDRSVFTPDGIAMTSAAITRAKSKGDYSYGQRPIEGTIKDIADRVALVSGSIVIAGMVTYAAMSAGAAWFGLFSSTFEGMGLVIENGAFAITEYASMTGTMAPGVAAVANSSASLFGQSLQAVFLTAAGKAVGIITAVAIAVLIIAVAIFLFIDFAKDDDDQLYTAIPRILLSEETVYTGKFDDHGNKGTTPGYAYYYGVKNLELNENSKDPDGNSLANQVMDVANWSLHGATREWIALYECHDPKLAKEPILADSLKIVAELGTKSGPSKTNVVKFFNENNCNFEAFYQSMLASHDSYKNKYLTFERAEPERSNSGSVFSNGSVLGAGAIGLVIGACGATAITLFAQKKKKKA